MADDNSPRDTERGRKGRRPEREPATIDLTAERIADTTPADSAPAEAAPSPPATPPPGTEPVAEAIAAVPPDADATPSEAAPTQAADAAPPVEPAPEPAPEPAGEAPAAPPEAAPEAIAEPAPPPPVPVRQPRPQRGLPMALGFGGGLAGGAVMVLLLTFVGPFADAPDRITALEASVGDKATRRAVDALDKRVATAESAAQALRTDIDGLSRRPALAPSDLAPLTQRLDRLDRAVAQLAARPAEGGGGNATPAPVQLPPVVVAGRESAALAVAMLVRDAVGRGVPYAREIAALDASGLQPDAVARLKPLATEGAPTPAALAAAFAPLAVKLASVPEPPPSAGWVDRLTAWAGRVVKVRPVGNVAGDDPGAIGARTEAALRRGDLAAAQAALAALPAASRPTVQSFADRLAARIAAGQAADSLVAAAVDQVIAATASTGVPAR